MGAPPVWSHAGSGVLAGTRGAGVTVAVLDTGLDTAGPLGARYRGGEHDWLDAYGRYAGAGRRRRTAAPATAPASAG